MRVMIGATTHDIQRVAAIRTVFEMQRHLDDGYGVESKMRGDITRESILATFLEDKRWDALLMLDGDHKHPRDLLERLRVHLETGGLDMVCAHYYHRGTKPIQSLCYPVGDGTWPQLPYLDPPTEGLHELLKTGFGCVLIRRNVLEAVQALQPPGMSAFAIAPMPEMQGDYDNWGQDFRFFLMARRLGFRLWLDASVESLHSVPVWLGHKLAKKLINYADWANGSDELFKSRLELHGVNVEAFKQRQRILEARQRGFLAEAEAYKNRERTPEEEQKFMDISVAIYEMNGRLKECGAWIEWIEKFPKIERPDQLPTTENTPPMAGEVKSGDPDERMNGHRTNAMELIESLPDVT